jgi:hypothetical protein
MSLVASLLGDMASLHRYITLYIIVDDAIIKGIFTEEPPLEYIYHEIVYDAASMDKMRVIRLRSFTNPHAAPDDHIRIINNSHMLTYAFSNDSLNYFEVSSIAPVFNIYMETGLFRPQLAKLYGLISRKILEEHGEAYIYGFSDSYDALVKLFDNNDYMEDIAENYDKFIIRIIPAFNWHGTLLDLHQFYAIISPANCEGIIYTDNITEFIDDYVVSSIPLEMNVVYNADERNLWQ